VEGNAHVWGVEDGATDRRRWTEGGGDPGGVVNSELVSTDVLSKEEWNTPESGTTLLSKTVITCLSQLMILFCSAHPMKSPNGKQHQA
jgi:hypothetical protein